MKTGKFKLSNKHLQVLQEISQQGVISRSQLTVGPLRHVERKKRRRIVDDLVRGELLEEVFLDRPPRGPQAHHFRITEQGRKACPPLEVVRTKTA